MEAVVLRDIGPGEGINPNGYSLLSLPRFHLVSRRQNAAKAVWPRETIIAFDGEWHLSDESGIFARDQLLDQ